MRKFQLSAIHLNHGFSNMFPKSKLTWALFLAGLVIAGMLIRAADAPGFLFGLGTDFISGVLFGVAIALSMRAISESYRRS